LKKYLSLSIGNKSEAYYWIGKNYLELEEYGLAINNFNMALDKKYAIKSWVSQNSAELIKTAEAKNHYYKARVKMAYGYDNNILRDNYKVNDQLGILDVYQDYYFIRKKKTQLNIGLDISYQSYANYHIYQFASGSVRLDYLRVLTDSISNSGSISGGKSLSDFKSDQNYLFATYYVTIGLSKKVEIQPSLVYFANLNNNPVKQTSFSLSGYYYLDSDYAWLTPFYRKSASPDPVIEISGGTPYIAQYSATTNYTQMGLIVGYQKSLGEKFGLTFQYSYTKSEYQKYDLSSYPASSVLDKEGRIDEQHTVRLALQYQQAAKVRWTLSNSATFNKSKGFQGFTSPYATPSSPDSNASYDQNLTSLSVTLDFP
ncbi:MAG: hypothetical protein H7235_04250, partial [Bdellovibrionaceae bacterium]|nr:hypothetical protein [Pseudobdellovibrionaceae bacterium]